MAYTINDPPVGVVVSLNPSTQELAQRSNNTITRLKRSLDGRSFKLFLNGFPLDQVTSRKALADVYPVGTDPNLDIEHDRGGAGHPPQ